MCFSSPMTEDSSLTKNLTTSTAAMGVCKTEIPDATLPQKGMDTASPKLLEAWLAHQERLKHIQLAQQQHQNLYHQQQAAAAAALFRSATATDVSPAMTANPAAVMFNLYYQVCPSMK